MASHEHLGVLITIINLILIMMKNDKYLSSSGLNNTLQLLMKDLG